MSNVVRIGLVCGLLLLTNLASSGGTTRYVSTEGTHITPFVTLAEAATNIQAALDVSEGGDTVLVTNGTYNLDSQINVTNAVLVESWNGPEVTLVVGKSGVRVFNITDAGAVISGFTITNGILNADYDPGAGVLMTGGTVSNCIVTQCKASRGSTVDMNGGLLTHCTIVGNVEKASYFGVVGVKLTGGATMRHCTITGNMPGSDDNSSVVQISGASTVDSCVISNNFRNGSTVNHSAVRLNSAGAVLRNSLIVNNPTRGVYMAVNGTIENCTISGNSVASGSGNGVWMSSGKLLNSIVYYNGVSPYTSLAGDVLKTGGAVSNSCTGVLIPDNDNIDDAPLFTDRVTGDFTLRPGSTCIDSGLALDTITEDINGTARPIDGDGVGGAQHDMGAYEAPSSDTGVLRCGFSASNHESVGTLTAAFTPYAAGADTDITFAGWNFGDGATSNRTDLTPASHTYGPGYFSVSLTLSNALGQSATAVMTNDIRVAPEGTYVSLSGADTFPYATWETAAHSIQAAVDVLLITGAETRVVMVTNGLYAIDSQIALQKPVRVQSVNGPADTIIKGKSGIRVFYMTDANAMISGLTITNGILNGQYVDGAGIWMAGGTVTNCIVIQCKANRGAAGLYANGGLITHSSFLNNQLNDDYGEGGVSGASLTGGAMLEYSLFAGNKAGARSGGVSAIKTAGGSTVQYCTVRDELRYSATTESYAVYVTGVGDLIRNCLIVNNATRGIHMKSGGTIESCTISSNSVQSNVGNGVQMTHAAGVLRNSIVWGNGNDNSQNLDATAGTVEFTDVNPPTAGTGNLNSDPTFVAFPMDFRLSAGSPVIDKGTNQNWMSSPVADLDGANRIIAAVVDLGVYEAEDASLGPLSVNFDTQTTVGFTNFAVVFTATPVGGDINITSYSWTFGDGNTQSGGADKAVVTNVYTSPGVFDVTLVAINVSEQSANKTKPSFIYAVPSTIYVATNGLHQMPFDTLIKAATNIADALAAARVVGPDHTDVLVDGGTHYISGQLDVNKAITVRSLHGRDNTIVSRIPAAGSFRIFNISDVGAVVDGFTITKGYRPAENSGCGVHLTAGTLQNCIVISNTAWRAASGLWMSSGVVSNCVIRDNRDDSDYSNVGAVRISNGLLVDCKIEGNKWAPGTASVGGLQLNGGEVRNCVISSNLIFVATDPGTFAGGVRVSGGVLRNCLVFGNDGVGINLAGGAVANCTVVRNVKEGAVYNTGSVTNTIIYYNNNGGADISGATSSFGHSCSPDLAHDPNGSGNTTNAPRFKNVGSGYGGSAVMGDYHLAAGSPCINTGISAAWMLNATDLDGFPRINGQAPDMGAYEAPPGSTVFFIR